MESSTGSAMGRPWAANFSFCFVHVGSEGRVVGPVALVVVKPGGRVGASVAGASVAGASVAGASVGAAVVGAAVVGAVVVGSGVV
jgi:hypothetical protein